MARATLVLFALLVSKPCLAEPAAAPAPGAQSPPAPAEGPPSAEAAPEPPTPSPATACAEKHEAAQVERMAGHLLEARDALLACAHEECPSVVRVDCAEWLDEVRAAIPTVVFEAIGNDGLMTDVEVRLGQQLLTKSLDGKPIEVPVGLSEFTFTRPAGESKSLRVLLRQGETSRIVSVDFRTQEPTPSPVPSSPPPAPVAMVDARPVPNSVWLLGTATLVATLTGATLGIVAKVKEGEAAGTCAPDCTDSVVSEIEDLALAADISFGVAILAGVTTTILYLGRPTVRVPRRAARHDLPHVTTRQAFAIPRLVATSHGGWLGLEGHFP